MGGHGFSMYSGLPGIIGELAPTPTYEGKNSIYFRLKYDFIFASCKIFNQISWFYCKR